MVKIDVDGSLPDEQRCIRSDGKRWRCSRPSMEGRGFCKAHYLQSVHRKNKEPVPSDLMLVRARRGEHVLKVEEQDSNGNDGEVALRRGTRKRIETLIDLSEISPESEPRKRGKRIIKEEKEKKPIPTVQASASLPQSTTVKQEASRPIQTLPSVKANIKAASKKKIIKKCHWCKFSSYRVLVKCSTCKKQFFCQECIDQRFHCKTSIKRECPVCLGTCECRACTREVKTKGLVVYDLEEELVVSYPEKELFVYNPEDELVVSNPEKDLVVYNREKKFDKTQQLHLIRVLLPLMEIFNQEKSAELDTEAKNKGRTHGELLVQHTEDSQKQQCYFCDAWVPDYHRSCGCCSYILCALCCNEFRDGYLHTRLADLKNTRIVRSKKVSNISWRFTADGSIRCPPENLGGCGEGLLKLTCFSPFNWTKDLEANAKQIVCKYKFKKPLGVASSPCLLCDGNDEIRSEKVGNFNKNKCLYFLTRPDFMDKSLEHFIKHWGNGQPLIIRDVLQREPYISWDFGAILYKYLQRGGAQMGSKRHSEWLEVRFGRQQIFKGGKTHENVWEEFLKFKLWLSSGFFQEQFPNHYAAVMQALPVKEYMNPLTGSLNLACNPLDDTENRNLGPYVYISYGGPEGVMDTDHLTKLCRHDHDVVNILAHATEHPISEKRLNEVKLLMYKYSSQDDMKSKRKIKIRNKLEELFGSSLESENTPNTKDSNKPNNEVEVICEDSNGEDSGDEDINSDDEDIIRHEIGSSSRHGEEQVNTCGLEWDVFRREDVSKIVEYLRKYSDELTKSYDSPKKVVHPIFDEIFYLDDHDKKKLKEEFDVEAWSFEQHIGEAVIIPAGCVYQMKKIKSCVNVVLEFISPESASECIKVGDELRQLPVNHKAKGKVYEVKKMVIDGMDAAIEEIRKVSHTNDTPKE